jgi:NAD(P)-dependent dehydrogenase (short-subunit alcohol dehydrogenase family)
MSARIAMVTGAGGAIGRAVSRALARSGWTVVLAGRRSPSLEETASEIASDRALPVTVDVCDAGSVFRLFDTVEKRFGNLDLLFNNAGTDVPGVPLEELSVETWLHILNTNLTGQFLCAQAAFKLMKRQSPMGGRIINNGSIAAHAPRPNSTAYTASKHGVTGLTKALMLDGRPYRIAACQIDIGNAADDPAAARPMKLQPGGESAEPFMSTSDVAAAVLFMADLPLDANAAFVTVMATNMPFVGRG